MSLKPIGHALAAVAAQLAPKAEPARKPAWVNAYAWIPALEVEAGAYPVRLRSTVEVALYRHALAVSNGQAAREASVIVLVRNKLEVEAFVCEMAGANAQSAEPIPCCRVCGATDLEFDVCEARS